MKNRIFAFAGIAVLVIGVAVFALGRGLVGIQHGQGRGDGPSSRHFGGPEMVEHMSRALDLTDAQKAQVKTILESAEATAGPLMKKMDEVHKQLEAATANGQFDETQIRALANQQAQAMADSIVEHERTKSKIYIILTPEQRAKADELHKRGGPHHRHGPPASDN
ncbi:MAG: Spy/CpxP family protein refolding chaperone [Pyrinomonadaceae bacterium]